MSEAGRNAFSNPKLRVLAAIAVLGLVAAVWQPVGLEDLLEWGGRVGSEWWFLLLVMVAMVVLLTFGLPGSLGVWLIAPFNHPVLATALLVAATTVGCLSAYRFAGHMGRDWQPSGTSARVVELLRTRSDFLILLAMRMLPGFPHSVINFASGVLGVPLATFLTASMVGLTIKWGVYTSAIYGITDAIEGDDAITPGTVLPLVVLVVMALAGAWLRRRAAATKAGPP